MSSSAENTPRKSALRLNRETSINKDSSVEKSKDESQLKIEENPEEEYFKTAMEEVKSFLNTLRKDKTIEPVEEYFKKDNKIINELNYKQVLLLYFKNYYDCYKDTAFLRIPVFTQIHKEWEGNQEDFIEVFNERMVKGYGIDLPFFKKCCASVMVEMKKNCGISFDDWKIEFTAEGEFGREDQSWFYRDVLDALKDAQKEAGVDFGDEFFEKKTADAKDYKKKE